MPVSNIQFHKLRLTIAKDKENFQNLEVNDLKTKGKDMNHNKITNTISKLFHIV